MNRNEMDAFENHLKQWKQKSKQLHGRLDPILEAQRAIEKALRPIIETQNGIKSQLEPFLEQQRKLQKALECMSYKHR
ncbi:MAG: hypothetical protein OEZ10_05445 [Gammaproteobacteria bacterium]|nr:hypothetical protein [Gammaproteobacteria bacterium]